MSYVRTDTGVFEGTNFRPSPHRKRSDRLEDLADFVIVWNEDDSLRMLCKPADFLSARKLLSNVSIKSVTLAIVIEQNVISFAKLDEQKGEFYLL